MLLGAPHQQRKSREGMVCAAAFRVGLGLSHQETIRGCSLPWVLPIFALHGLLQPTLPQPAAPHTRAGLRAWPKDQKERGCSRRKRMTFVFL